MTNQRWAVGAGLVIAALLAIILGIELVVLIFGSFSGRVSLPGMSKVVVLPIEGVILDSTKAMAFIAEQREDDHVKAMLLRIDSPGGGASASQEIFTELKKFRAAGKPIVASIGALGASGGYYLAAAADTIYVNPASEVGSIGVLFGMLNVAELFRKLGIREQTYTAGEMKNVPSMTEEMTPAQRAYIDALLKNVHEQFIGDVLEQRARRGMTRARLLPLADGRLFTGQQALAVGLADALGTFEDAKLAAARAAGIDGDPTLVYPPREDEGLFAQLRAAARGLNALVPAAPAWGLRYQTGY